VWRRRGESRLRGWACEIRSAPGDRQGVEGASPFAMKELTLTETSLICMSGFTGGHTRHCRHGAYTFPSRMGGSARWRSQPVDWQLWVKSGEGD
jgi:hypothetical protein